MSGRAPNPPSLAVGDRVRCFRRGIVGELGRVLRVGPRAVEVRFSETGEVAWCSLNKASFEPTLEEIQDIALAMRAARLLAVSER